MIADDNDRASEFEEQERMLRLAEHANKREKPPAEFDSIHCVDELCGLEIEPERLRHGFFRCYSCQTNRENRSKHFRK